MLSRALSLATVTLLIGCFTAGVVWAVENLDAGKSPSQIFSSTCSACHRSPRGLLKNTPASSLPGFLRQHYTTGTDMAALLSAYLISNGAADPRYQGKDQSKKDAKQKDAKQDARPDQAERAGRRQPPAAHAQEASRPDADGAAAQGEGARPDRGAKRFSRRHAAPEATPFDGQAPAPAQATTDSKSGSRQKQGRRSKPAAEEPPKAEQAGRGDPSKEQVPQDSARPETSAVDPAKTDAIKGEADKPDSEATKPSSDSEPAREGKSDTAKVDAPKESVDSEPAPHRPDPVPPVTPAPPASATTAPEPAASPSAAPAPATPPSVEATAPTPAPAAPAGPPTPPVSR
ncbi:hypothetical protein J6524_00505 [Bradyrhizobium sp. WSM 1738]|uniref:hypothetical protein n=1 Tax=Bradyrhizobium hereditatis TaxID=2821405 RepID=UPI001CE25BA9|nr:hypothetical protein [Bradyrhizobium hereditatis]MCA6113413.1 hypothetical protein [Bradyrhizobium hereditatis]